MSNELKEIVIKMLQENTGRHMLDSGGAYGRHWEANQKISSDIETWDKMPVVSLYCHDGTNSDISGTISIYHHLVNTLEWDDEVEEMNRKWRIFSTQEKFNDVSYENCIEPFFEMLSNYRKYPGFYQYDFGNEKTWSGYTYNSENSLSQDFIWYKRGDWVFIQIHNGCDARGGFTVPVIFKFTEELWSIDDYTIYCNKENHYWDRQGYGSFYTETEFEMKDENIIGYSQLSDEEQILFDKENMLPDVPEEIFATDGQILLNGFDVRLKKPATVGKLVIKGKFAYCPCCGGELFGDKLYSG